MIYKLWPGHSYLPLPQDNKALMIETDMIDVFKAGQLCVEKIIVGTSTTEYLPIRRPQHDL